MSKKKILKEDIPLQSTKHNPMVRFSSLQFKTTNIVNESQVKEAIKIIGWVDNIFGFEETVTVCISRS